MKKYVVEFLNKKSKSLKKVIIETLPSDVYLQVNDGFTMVQTDDLDLDYIIYLASDKADLDGFYMHSFGEIQA